MSSKQYTQYLSTIASQILAESGVDVKKLQIDDRNTIRNLAKEMENLSGADYSTCKRHIKQAILDARGETMKRQWGGPRQGSGRPRKRWLIIFDKDGTLTEFDGRPANHPEEQKLLPGVAERIAQLRERGCKIAIASNQGGVAWGFISYDQAEALMADAAAKIGADAWRFCPHDPRAAGKPGANEEYAVACSCRKPEPGMLIELMQQFGATPDETLFVGDRDEDREAARRAGVRFISAKRFFFSGSEKTGFYRGQKEMGGHV
jgi:D-glycero-D-manno-heptose 1,7-bisphosphate phosphatase